MNAETLPMVANAGAFEAWLMQAGDGAMVVYAAGFELPRFAACTVLAREWEKAKLVSLRAYKLDDGSWRWVARRVVGERQGARSGPQARANNQYDESPKQSAMRLIRRHVNLSLPCPTLAQVAKIAGYADDEAGRQAARRLLQTLQGEGEIRVQNHAGGKRRIVIERGDKAGRATGWLDMTGQSLPQGSAR